MTVQVLQPLYQLLDVDLDLRTGGVQMRGLAHPAHSQGDSLLLTPDPAWHRSHRVTQSPLGLWDP